VVDGGSLKQRLVRYPRAYGLVARAHRVLRYAARIPHERDFAYFAELPDRGGLFLDVGANAGTSAMSFRLYNKRSPILSIEPNPAHERDLRLVKRIVPRFDYLLCGAGEHNARLTLHVPVYRGVAVSGEATLVADDLSLAGSWFLRDLPEARAEDFHVREIDVEVRRLDDLGLAPDYVKIDVEGAELSVLKGLDETIRRCRPIMLIEASAVPAIGEHLRGLGYDVFGLASSGRRLEPYRAGSFVNVFCLPAAAGAERGPGTETRPQADGAADA